MFDFMKHIPALSAPTTAPDVDAEEERRERIDWHRRNVRTGPANFKTISAGRQASREGRRREAAFKRNAAKHRRAWMKQEQERARLRGVLEVTGRVPTATRSAKPSPDLIRNAIVGAALKYGESTPRTDRFIDDALDAAEARYQAMSA